MVDKREDDFEPYTKFRTSRFVKESCEWYFLTREGTQEGPFERKIDVYKMLLFTVLQKSDFIDYQLVLYLKKYNA